MGCEDVVSGAALPASDFFNSLADSSLAGLAGIAGGSHFLLSNISSAALVFREPGSVPDVAACASGCLRDLLAACRDLENFRDSCWVTNFFLRSLEASAACTHTQTCQKAC